MARSPVLLLVRTKKHDLCALRKSKLRKPENLRKLVSSVEQIGENVSTTLNSLLVIVFFLCFLKIRQSGDLPDAVKTHGGRVTEAASWSYFNIILVKRKLSAA